VIRYDLECEAGHGFDGWFRDSAGFDDQRAADAVVCPVCASTSVDKVMMTPGLPARRSNNAPEVDRRRVKAAAMREMMRKVREHVEANADYVGDAFPEEARRIYYKEAEERGIYGEATAEDARALKDEGIDVMPLPPSPKQEN
jgi:hypothetical protein